MRHLKTSLPVLVIALAAAALAQDLSGTWSGTIKADTPEGPQEQSGVIIIKQDGGKLAVTAGPAVEEQYPANKVERNGDSLTFEVGPVGEPPKVLKFDLIFKESRLSGQVTVTSDAQRVTGKLDFTKEAKQ